MPKKENIRQMFDSIAPDYDRLNHLMSLGTDRRWRRRAIRRIADARDLQVLDVAAGTGDFSIAIASKLSGGHVTGIDLSEGMLDIMRSKVAAKGLSGRISCQCGDGEALRFAEGSFDRVAIAFGIRNFENRAQGLREMLRVLVPGGRVVILELSVPESGIIRWFYNLWFRRIMSKLGGRISGNKAAYDYLPASIVKFPQKQAFMAELAAAGFTSVTHRSFTFGVCRMYTAEKP